MGPNPHEAPRPDLVILRRHLNKENCVLGRGLFADSKAASGKQTRYHDDDREPTMSVYIMAATWSTQLRPEEPETRHSTSGSVVDDIGYFLVFKTQVSTHERRGEDGWMSGRRAR